MPNRIIKESIRTSDTLSQVSADAERLFWRLVVSVDDFGRFDGRPNIIIGQCLSAFYGDVTIDQVEEWMHELQEAELLKLYIADNKPYLYLTNWKKHQRTRAKDSKFPPPADTRGHPLSNDSKRGHVQTNVVSNVFENENENENVFVNENVIGNVNEYENENEVAAASENNHMNSSSSLDPLFGQVTTLYRTEGFGDITAITTQQLNYLYDEYGGEWMIEAIKECVFQNKRRISYMTSILQNWRADGGIRRSGGVRIEFSASSRTNQSTGRPRKKSITGGITGRIPPRDSS